MHLNFTEDEMCDFLMMHGYIIMVRVHEEDVNVYQNVFKTYQHVVTEAYKNSSFKPLLEAFQEEFKQRLILFK